MHPGPEPSSPRAAQRFAALLAAVAILATPPARALLKGALLVPEVVPAPVHPLTWLTPGPRREQISLPAGVADLYRPAGPVDAPGVVVVHGANQGGKDDPRVIALASALAREGRRVLVPQLGLRNQRLDPTDPQRIRDAIAHLATATGSNVGILAFSYGAGLTLVAITEQPAIQREVSFVATVGTYFNLFDLLEGATTQRVPGRRGLVGWKPDPSALGLGAAQLADFLGGADGTALAAAWAAQAPGNLSPRARPVYDLLANRDPAYFGKLVAGLPLDLVTRLEGLSPSQWIDRIRVPVYALHARTDPASPPSESELLVAALQGQVRTRLSIVGNLSHVSPTRSVLGDVADAARLADFAGTALRAQEGWPRP